MVVMNFGAIESKLNNARTRGRYLAATQAMLEMNKFVPYSGKQRAAHLRDTAHVNSNASSIIYSTPYARAQFYGVVGGGYPVRHYTTPGTSRRWDLRLKGDRNGMQNVVKAFAGGLK